MGKIRIGLMSCGAQLAKFLAGLQFTVDKVSRIIKIYIYI